MLLLKGRMCGLFLNCKTNEYELWEMVGQLKDEFDSSYNDHDAAIAAFEELDWVNRVRYDE